MDDVGSNGSVVECGLEPHDYLEVKFFLISIVGSLIGLFGLFGNASTALILTRPSMRNPNNLFLTALAVFDSCLLITAFFIYAMEYIIEYTQAFDLYVAWLTYLRFAFALSHISQTGSVYITVSVTIERYLAVCHPRRSKQMCNSGGAAWTILGVTTFAVLFNATKFFELEVTINPICPDGKNWQSYILLPSVMAANPLYQQVYALWLTNIVMVFLPFITLLVLNAYIAYTIRKSLEKFDNHQQNCSQQHCYSPAFDVCFLICLIAVRPSASIRPLRLRIVDFRSIAAALSNTSNVAREIARLPDRSELKEKSREATLVLVIIVCIFLICNFWGFVLTLLERIVDHETLMVEHHTFYTFSREAINFLAIINSSINFVIYIVFGKEFRKELVVVYGCGMRGITMRLPVHDKFTIWRTWGKRAKSISISGRSNLSAHVLSSASNLDIPTLDHLEQTRFLQEPQHDKNGNRTQTKCSPIRIIENGSGKSNWLEPKNGTAGRRMTLTLYSAVDGEVVNGQLYFSSDEGTLC
ncbi:hypothetical protein Y032_0065g3677 [Ancylostoma ceylanicum]|uniref:G-protein coupled receptors family 1 profile domain-containing protein n=1 Tax=Ancylostoma ceylanicum TaxID=53326 RepID=A0A016U114_9BILA|nr:hypothetical protein Y032_0065g3677 [Ancylostoma ceylanicum]